MNLSSNPIWQALQQFQISSTTVPLTFSQRLARENGWSHSFAKKVIVEYKRFIFLVSLSKSELTPSDAVDQVWHLHLSYTQSYWRDLCASILKFELHHNPTAGGEWELVRFRQQYSNTLTFYNKIFGEAPPSNIWPNVASRFRQSDCFVRVNNTENWVIRKPNFSFQRVVMFTAIAITLVGCTSDLADKSIWFWLKVAFGVYIIYKVCSWLDTGKGSGGGCGNGCGGCGGS